MQYAVVTCKVCGRGWKLDWEPKTCPHDGDDDLVLEMLDLDDHSVTGACREVHCFFHHQDESSVGAYRVCYECGHAYGTPDDLLDAVLDRRRAASEITHCPYCGCRFRQVSQTGG